MARPSAPEGTDPYLERVDRLTRRLSSPEVSPGDLAGALDAVRDVATLDGDVPTSSRRRRSRLLKAVVKRLVAWYFVYLAEQVNDLGFALVRLAGALVARAESSEALTAHLEERVAELEARVRALEGAAQKDADHEG